MRQDSPARVQQPTERRCGRCDGPLGRSMRTDARYCSSACRQSAYRRRADQSRNAADASRNDQIAGQLTIADVVALMDGEQ